MLQGSNGDGLLLPGRRLLPERSLLLDGVREGEMLFEQCRWCCDRRRL
jgi:hypothetical protein